MLQRHNNRRFVSDLSVSRWQLQFEFTDGYEMTQIDCKSKTISCHHCNNLLNALGGISWITNRNDSTTWNHTIKYILLYMLPHISYFHVSYLHVPNSSLTPVTLYSIQVGPDDDIKMTCEIPKHLEALSVFIAILAAYPLWHVKC